MEALQESAKTHAINHIIKKKFGQFSLALFYLILWYNNNVISDGITNVYSLRFFVYDPVKQFIYAAQPRDKLHRWYKSGVQKWDKEVENWLKTG